jgi:hypothetical protein
MRSAARLAFVVLVALGASSAAAQPRRGGGGSAAGSAERRNAAALERREQIKRKIRAMRAYTLTEALDLDERTAGKLFPLLSRYDDEIDKLLEKRADVQRRLAQVEPRSEPRAIDRLIEEALVALRGLRELEDRRLADLRKILTPAQTAKLLGVLPAMERKLQRQLRKAIVPRLTDDGADDGDDDQQPDELAPAPPPPRRPVRRREMPLAPRRQTSNARSNTAPCDPRIAACR